MDVLDDVVRRLDPVAARAAAIASLDALFASGEAAAPDGFLRGSLVATTTARPLDAFGRVMARAWMPWTGKVFEPSDGTGLNRFLPSARALVRPFTSRLLERDGHVDAVPFVTRVAPGALDADAKVLKIDYDIDGNPAIVRRILDELVRVDDGLFLGKVLVRVRGGWRRAGYFTLSA